MHSRSGRRRLRGGQVHWRPGLLLRVLWHGMHSRSVTRAAGCCRCHCGAVHPQSQSTETAARGCVTLAAAQCARPCERRAREAASGPTAVAPLAARSRLHARFSPRRWPRHHHCWRTNTTVATVHVPLISAPAWSQCARLRSRRWQLGLDHEPSGRYRSSPSPRPC